MPQESQEFITLREYIDVLWAAHHQQHVLQDHALDTAYNELKDRLHSMNEIRQQLNTQAETFLTKEQFHILHQPLIQFRDRFLGIVVGLTALNVVITLFLSTWIKGH